MLIWETIKKSYINGEIARLNRKWIVFELFWDALEYEEGSPYKLICFLPGIKKHLGKYDFESGKKQADYVMKYWLDKADLIDNQKQSQEGE